MIVTVAAALVAGGCASTGTETNATIGAATGATTRSSTAATIQHKRAASAHHLARRIESAHGLESWRNHDVVASDITVSFGPNPMLEGVMLYDPAGGRVRIERTDGTVLIFDGGQAWISPSSAEAPMARFHLLTWPYFMAAPYKLRDPGTRLTPFGRHQIDGAEHVTAMLTFDAGVGDSPDDWYVVYEDTDTHRLAAMAYIVTYGGKSAEEAEQDVHVVLYDDFESVENALIATSWDFYNWTAGQGAHGESLGRVKLTNLRFVELDESVFARPADAREDPLPGG